MVVGKLRIAGIGQMPEALGPANALAAILERDEAIILQPSQHLTDSYGRDIQAVRQCGGGLRPSHFERIEHAVCRAILHGCTLPTYIALNSTVGIGLWVVLLMPVAQASTSVYLVMTLQDLWSYGPTKAGAFNATFAIAWSTCAILIANIQSPTRRAFMIRLGPALLVAGLSVIVVGFSLDVPLVVMLGQMSIGTGFGVSWGFLSQNVMEAARSGERDRASALLPTLQSAGYAIGAAVAGLVANASGYPEAATPDALRDATIMIFSVSAIIGLGAMIAGFALPLRRKNLLATEMHKPL